MVDIVLLTSVNHLALPDFTQVDQNLTRAIELLYLALANNGMKKWWNDVEFCKLAVQLQNAL